MVIWAIPGAGKSTFIDNNPDLDIVDFDMWYVGAMKKHPKIRKKIGKQSFVEFAYKKFLKHRPTSILLTSRVKHIKHADAILIHFNIPHMMRRTDRPGREKWSESKCRGRMRAYKKLIHRHNKPHHLMLGDEYFSDTIERLGLSFDIKKKK